MRLVRVGSDMAGSRVEEEDDNLRDPDREDIGVHRYTTSGAPTGRTSGCTGIQPQGPRQGGHRGAQV